jgi:hypothetical protein
MLDESTADCHTVYLRLGRMVQVRVQRVVVLQALLGLLVRDGAAAMAARSDWPALRARQCVALDARPLRLPGLSLPGAYFHLPIPMKPAFHLDQGRILPNEGPISP